MIIDTLDNLGKYVGLNPLFADVVEFLKKNDLNTMEAGKYPIKDKDLFVNITTAKGKAPDEAVLEMDLRPMAIHHCADCQGRNIMQKRISQNTLTSWQKVLLTVNQVCLRYFSLKTVMHRVSQWHQRLKKRYSRLKLNSYGSKEKRGGAA